MKINSKTAVTFGRFNYFSKGHIYFFEEILKKWEKLVIVCLENSTSDERLYTSDDLLLNVFYKECDANFEKTLLPITTRLEAINIFAKKYPNRVTVTQGGRPENSPNDFNRCFPVSQFDLVFSKDYSKYFDLLRFEAFEKILERKVIAIHPSKYIHNTEIARLSDKKDMFWPEVWNYYKKKGIRV